MKQKPFFVVILLILVMAVVAGGTILVHHYVRTGNQRPANPTSQPDQYIINFTSYEYDHRGVLQSMVRATKAMHYVDKNTTVFVRPEVLAYRDHETPWQINADHGLMQSDTSLIYLWGSVVIHQRAQRKSPETTIKTQQVTYFPDRSVAETDRPVIITRPGITLEADGMTVDLAQGVINTKSHTRGSYQKNEK